MTQYKFTFTAINKGFSKARKNSKGDIISWECRLANYVQ